MSMLTASSLEGTYTALITPFGADGRPDFQAFSLHVERQIEAGIDGLVPCGTTGEAATMTAEEQASLIAVCVEVAAGRVPVIAGVGSMSTRASVELTQAAASAGAAESQLVMSQICDGRVNPDHDPNATPSARRHFCKFFITSARRRLRRAPPLHQFPLPRAAQCRT